MSGCFGNSPEDIHFENMLDKYLKEEQESDLEEAESIEIEYDIDLSESMVSVEAIDLHTGELIGLAVVEFIGNSANLNEIYIHTNFRGKGIATKLGHIVLEQLKKQHIFQVNYLAEVLNDTVHDFRFLTRLNFHFVKFKKGKAKFIINLKRTTGVLE